MSASATRAARRPIRGWAKPMGCLPVATMLERRRALAALAGLALAFGTRGSKVLAAASTTQADVREGLKSGKNTEAAARVGRAIAERAKAVGIDTIAFDRSGYRYHGRIKALADAAREAGLQF